MSEHLKNPKWLKSFNGWWHRWWIPVVVAVIAFAVPAVATWLVPVFLKWWFPSYLKQYSPGDFFTTVWVQVSGAAFTAVFIGVLTRNSSREQARQAARVQRDHDLRSRSSQLMSHQASAIEHLGDKNPVVQAAGVNELIWLMRGWTTLTVDSLTAIKDDETTSNGETVDASIDSVGRRWVDHVQQLVDLAYKQQFQENTEDLLQKSNVKGAGLLKLSIQLTGPLVPGQPNSFQRPSWFSISSLDLNDADLVNVVLWGAELDGAHRRGAELDGAHLQNANLVGAVYDKNTKFPEGVDCTYISFID